MIQRALCTFAILILCVSGCGRDLDAIHPNPIPEPTDRNLIVLIIDGARYTETFGDTSYKNIPLMRSLMRQGAVCTNMYIDGVTNTVNGHATICTGHYESLNNAGQEYPTFPSFFQYWRRASGKDSSSAWIIASKDKLEVLSDCIDPAWKGKFRPSTDCGVNGLGSGYRDDSVTFNNALTQLQVHKPKVMLINLKEPDAAGHSGSWPLYLEGIRQGDKYAYRLWDFIQHNAFYRSNTMLIITSDHGRHSDGWSNGFVSHGDSCDGCRHISFMALGPDVCKGYVDTTSYSQNDIASTIAKVLGLEMPHASGNVMEGILK